MVTLIKYGALSGGEKYNVNALSLDGLSTDTKPTRTYIEYGSDGREVGRTGIPNGSLYTEIDTGDTYMYDADNTTWHKVSIGGGGGSGTDNYNELSNKPQINSITLSGNKSLANLGIQAELIFDDEPTEDSTNPVTSGAVYTALATKQDMLTVDSSPTENSTNPVQSGGVYTALAGKEDTLTFDNAPTNNSDNPVKSGGIYTALGQKQDTLTFDGTYSASTNKAATVSTVTNAVNALDVTGDASVSASKTISAWSETDGKVSISTQDIAIAGTQAVLTGYTPESPAQTDSIVATDTVNTAIKKLDERSRVDENNILSEQAKTTGMTEGGSNYITVGGIRVYVSATAPTGDIPDGSVGVGW